MLKNDVAVTRLDPLSNWNPRWLPANMNASYIDDFDIEAGFTACNSATVRCGCRPA
ncbi:MAG TPA: hypothetical protein VMK84_24800 [Streptosporangiaceae bacterium]|nr:hypothetical protein [Streptosporangiaceae bacterium]